MSDSNSNNANVTAQIDAMVGAQPTSPGGFANLQQNTQGMIISTESDEVVLTSDAPPSDGVQRIPDIGLDLGAEAQRLVDGLSDLQSRLDEVKHDPVTGAKSYVLAGAARDRVQLQRDQAEKTAVWQLGRFDAVAAQRAADAQAKNASLSTEAAKLAYTQGNPARAKVWDEVMEREQATLAVREAITKK